MSFDPSQIPALRDNSIDLAFRLLLLGALIGLLLVPLSMIRGLVAERQQRSLDVEQEIAALWGEQQAIGGPVLTIPYLVHTTTERDGKRVDHVSKQLAHFLPETLGIEARIDAETRYKGIYQVLVYLAEAKLTGRFSTPQFGAWGVAPADVLWDEATLALGITDMSGIRSLSLAVSGEPVKVSPATLRGQIFASGAHARLALSPGAAPAFSVDIALNGSESLQFLPMGGETTLTIAGNWPHPSFIGAFLPVERDIAADGFAARWTVSQLSRDYPQSWRSSDLAFDKIEDGRIGLGLVLPGDAYQQTDRIMKYGILIVGLTFSTIFVLGLLRSVRAHFVQYLLVGGSICVFYLLLLSLAEHLRFPLAYAIASVIDIATIALYAARTIRPLLGGIMAALLASLHGYMYLLMQAEDYSLLAGSFGLLAVLLAIMIVTRNIDWFAKGEEVHRTGSPAPAQ